MLWFQAGQGSVSAVSRRGHNQDTEVILYHLISSAGMEERDPLRGRISIWFRKWWRELSTIVYYWVFSPPCAQSLFPVNSYLNSTAFPFLPPILHSNPLQKMKGETGKQREHWVGESQWGAWNWEVPFLKYTVRHPAVRVR